jgi:hypothetical protein
MGWVCSRNEEKRNAYGIMVGKPEEMILLGKPEGKRLLGKPICRWVDNIKMDLRETGWGDWTGSIWLRIGINGGLLCYRIHFDIFTCSN